MHITTDRFSIRPIVPEEIDTVLAVYRQCEDFLALGPVAIASLKMVQADMELSKSRNGIFCGIYNPDGMMIGVIDIVPQVEPSAAFLELLMIGAPYRSQGLGAEIVRVMEAEIRRNPAVSVIKAGVQANNPGAKRFWDRMGYRIVAGPALMDDGTTCYDLLRELTTEG